VRYRWLADVVLTVHVAFVLFVVLGLVAVVIGGARGWRWVRNPWFRIAHLSAILLVAAQAWMDRICPLTTWEMWLRTRAGEETYAGSFVAYWFGRFLYYDAPLWAFATAYTVVAGVVAGTWFAVPPRLRRR